MQETISKAKVPFTTANVAKCMCPKCPVQGKSQCVADKMANIKEALKASPLKREQIPGEYCSTGTATCQDLNSKMGCICGTCAIFADYKLASGQPAGYFCRDGMAR